MQRNQHKIEAKVEVANQEIDRQVSNFVHSLMFLCALSVAMLAMFILPRI